MRLTTLKPMIWTNVLQETIDFYTNILGFTCGAHNKNWGWAALHRDSVEIMVAKPNAFMPFEKPLFTGSFYITTDDVDGLWEMVKDKAGIVYSIENFEWNMREFAINDNNGYILQFGQDIEEIKKKL